MPPQNYRRPDIADFLARSLAGTPDGPCVPHPNPVAATGYGYVSYQGRNLRAHRAVWLMAGRDLPDELSLDHICHDPRTCPGGSTCPHRACANIGHLAVSDPLDQAASASNKCRNPEHRVPVAGDCPDCTRERKRKYDRANRERARERLRAWRAANPDKYRAQYDRRRSRELGSPHA